MKNPFVTNGYVSPEYFCDREKETAKIVSLLTNENNIALISGCPKQCRSKSVLPNLRGEIKAMLFSFVKSETILAVSFSLSQKYSGDT